ncbi:conserved hypothetical protein [delta proteobacterium NaphS2]|nr:conserved hypothetical protein [delta proteobacterium NaphS2]
MISPADQRLNHMPQAIKRIAVEHTMRRIPFLNRGAFLLTMIETVLLRKGRPLRHGPWGQSLCPLGGLARTGAPFF